MNATALQILREYKDWWTFIEYCHQTFGMSNVDVAKQSALAKICNWAVKNDKDNEILADLKFIVAFGNMYFNIKNSK